MSGRIGRRGRLGRCWLCNLRDPHHPCTVIGRDNLQFAVAKFKDFGCRVESVAEGQALIDGVFFSEAQDQLCVLCSPRTPHLPDEHAHKQSVAHARAARMQATKKSEKPKKSEKRCPQHLPSAQEGLKWMPTVEMPQGKKRARTGDDDQHTPRMLNHSLSLASYFPPCTPAPGPEAQVVDAEVDWLADTEFICQLLEPSITDEPNRVPSAY